MCICVCLCVCMIAIKSKWTFITVDIYAVTVGKILINFAISLSQLIHEARTRGERLMTGWCLGHTNRTHRCAKNQLQMRESLICPGLDLLNVLLIRGIFIPKTFTNIYCLWLTTLSSNRQTEQGITDLAERLQHPTKKSYHIFIFET